jgi:ParB/RepB/Spo0J family partition protein
VTPVIAFFNQKGGTAKTTSTLNVGAALAERGYRVLSLDLDPQASLTMALGIDIARLEVSVYDLLVEDPLPLSETIVATRIAGFDLVPSHPDLAAAELELLNALERERRLAHALAAAEPLPYDYVLIDSPPALNILSVNILVAATALVIPIEPHPLSLMVLRRLFETVNRVRRLNPRLTVLGFLPTKVHHSSRLVADMLATLRERFPDLPLLPSIPLSIKGAEAVAEHTSILQYQPRSPWLQPTGKLLLPSSNSSGVPVVSESPLSPTTRRRRFTVDDLLADTSPQARGTRELAEAREIALDRIEPDPDQPRRTFDPERLEELAASIRQQGVLQPIAVRYDATRDRYVIIHGERRWRAAQLAGLPTIPAIVRQVSDEQRLIQQLMENILREDLNALDRAAALRRLKQQLGDVPWEQVAETVGIKRSRLFQLLATEKLPEPVQEAIRTGRLSEKQTRPLQGLPEPLQIAVAQLIEQDGLPQAEIERLARTLRERTDLALLDPRELLPQLRQLIRPDRVSHAATGSLHPSIVPRSPARYRARAAPSTPGDDRSRHPRSRRARSDH